MDIGQRIRFLREQNSLSQLDLSRKLHISNSALSQYESGARTPSDDIKLKIASYFGVSVDYLLGLPDKQKAPNSNELDAIPGMKELEDVMSRLSDAGRETLLQQARALQSLEQSLKDQK